MENSRLSANSQMLASVEHTGQSSKAHWPSWSIRNRRYSTISRSEASVIAIRSPAGGPPFAAGLPHLPVPCDPVRRYRQERAQSSEPYSSRVNRLRSSRISQTFVARISPLKSRDTEVGQCATCKELQRPLRSSHRRRSTSV